MKHCPQCGKAFDDSWEVCIKCGSKLMPQDFEARLRNIEERLELIEKRSGIEVQKSRAAVKAPVEEKIKKRVASTDIESAIGLVWLNRIGILALLLGVGLFLKYAFDNGWIGVLERVLLGLVAGFGMAALGEMNRRKGYDVMAQGLHSGGVGVLYLSIYSAFGFYHLIPAIPAFVFMGIVTAFCVLWSVKTGWLSSMLIGIMAGFLTPLLIGTSHIARPLLYSYIALLDAGVIAVSIYKRWRALNILSFVMTILLFEWDIFSASAASDRPLLLLFSAAYFAIFGFLSVSRNIVHKEKSEASDIILVVANAIMFFVHLQQLLSPKVFPVPGLLPLSLGFLYALFSYNALTRCSSDKGLIASYVGLACFFVAIAIPIQFNKEWVTIGWAFESLALLWIGFSMKSPAVRKYGLAMGLLAIARSIIFHYPNTMHAQPFIGQDALIRLFVVISVFLGAHLYRKNAGQTEGMERRMAVSLIVLANILLVLHLSKEVDSFYTSIVWILYAFALVAVGVNRKFRALRIMALVLFGMAVLKIFFVDLSFLERVYRMLSFIALGIVMILASFVYQKYKNEIKVFTLKD